MKFKRFVDVIKAPEKPGEVANLKLQRPKVTESVLAGFNLKDEDKVLVQYVSEGLNDEQIAQMLGKTGPSISGSMHRLLTRLDLKRQDLINYRLFQHLEQPKTSQPQRPLSPQQKQVLIGVQRKMSKEEIAKVLGIKVVTIDNHLSGLRFRLGVSERHLMPLEAAKRGFLTLDDVEPLPKSQDQPGKLQNKTSEFEGKK